MINSPESLLAFIGSVEPRAVVREGAIAIRSMMTLSVAFDHRVVDGMAAAAFASCAGILTVKVLTTPRWSEPVVVTVSEAVGTAPSPAL